MSHAYRRPMPGHFQHHYAAGQKQPLFTDPVVLFAMEGFLLSFTGAINNFGNNLFATNLGATDAQLGLVQMIPNLIAMLLLLPLGILADKVKNVRTVPLLTLAGMAFGYFAMSFVPMTQNMRIPLFFFALAFTVGCTILYNAQWQNFFGEVVEYDSRNKILTHRNRFMFVISTAAPIVCGLMLTRYHNQESKLRVFQLFFFICAIVAISQMLVILRIQAPDRTVQKDTLTLRDVTDTIHKLVHNSSFLLFIIPVVFFYMVWQLDFSMWYIGQTKYLGLNESDLSLFNGIYNVGQLFAIGIISRIVQKKGNDYTINFAAFGLICCPVSIILTSLMPQAWHLPALTLFVTFLNAGGCAVNLCVVQILLRVTPKECRSLAISLYTLAITFTNSFMPSVGVKIYTAFGADYRGFVIFFVITAVLRTIAMAALIWRYLYLKKRNAQG